MIQTSMDTQGKNDKAQPALSRLAFPRRREKKPRVSDVVLLGSGSDSDSGTSGLSRFSWLIADVGRRTVTIGFQRMPDRLGIGFPQSRHWAKPSGLVLPQDEQYTGFRMEPQLMQYLSSCLFDFRQDGHEMKVPAMILFTIYVTFNCAIKQAFRGRILAF